MNVTFPYSWIKEFLVTKADLKTVVQSLNATGPTVEKIIPQKDDFLLDIEVTINRPDTLGVLGIAREMYASLRQTGIKASLKNDYLTDWVKVPTDSQKIPLKFKIDSRLTPRFNAVLLKNIKIGPSPKFIQARLEKSGVRTLNNVIDITNYLMLETGQPNHAFDFDKLTPPEFIIRGAKKGETIATLDNQEHKLKKGDIVIQDSSGQLIDLAGIMGGKLSEIDQKTTKVLFTVANDYYGQIRKTAMRLGIQTEASARLSKVLSPEITYPTLLRGIELLTKHAKAKVASEIVDLYPKPLKTPTISIKDEFIEEKVGVKIKPKAIDSILKSLGFKIKRSGHLIKVKPPIWRLRDVELPIDVVEEVARVSNYDSIPSKPLTFEIPPKAKYFQKIFKLEDSLRHLLTNQGYWENLSYSMLSRQDLANFNLSPRKAIKIANPLSKEWEIMQPTLAINLAKNLKLNYPFFPNLKIFEIANVFDAKGKESRHLIFGGFNLNFKKTKGILEVVLAAVEPDLISWKNKTDHLFLNPQSAKIIINQQELGYLGSLKKEVNARLEIKPKIFLAEINLEVLVKNLPDQPPKFSSFSIYPAIIQDLSFVVPPRTKTGKMLTAIRKMSPLVVQVKLLDAYQNTRTFRVNYQSEKKTLSGEEVNKIRQKIIREMMKRFQAQLKQ